MCAEPCEREIVAALPEIHPTFGPTHQEFYDLAHMRALPNMTVIDPCDNAETAEATHALVYFEGPVHLREPLGRETPYVEREATRSWIGEGQILHEGTDVGIVTSGVMVRRSLDAATALADQGVSAAASKMSTIKPFDGAALLALAHETGALVTAEIHSTIGGSFSCVSEVLAREGVGAPVRPRGRARRVLLVRTNDYVAETHGLTAGAASAAAEEAIAARR